MNFAIKIIFIIILKQELIILYFRNKTQNLLKLLWSSKNKRHYSSEELLFIWLKMFKRIEEKVYCSTLLFCIVCPAGSICVCICNIYKMTSFLLGMSEIPNWSVWSSLQRITANNRSRASNIQEILEEQTLAFNTLKESVTPGVIHAHSTKQGKSTNVWPSMCVAYVRSPTLGLNGSMRGASH